MLLSLSPVGEVNQIKAIWAEDNIRARLEEVGISVDCEVSVVLKTFKEEALIVNVNGKRIGIGEELARKIVV
ncbi:FeoA family protein [Clostridium aminobutyricum]|nr:FeoA family protein [Clostridium aminobutyricum]